MSASKSLVTTKPSCPLCNSKSRRAIDLLCAELRNPQVEEVVDTESGVITEKKFEPFSMGELEQQIHKLLAGFNDDQTKFDLTDLVAHVTQHALAVNVEGIAIRSEGNLLFVGDTVYHKVDLKDSLQAGIAIGLQQLLSGQMKMSANTWAGLHALLWRMSGTSGDDPFIKEMMEKTQAANVNPDSPLGASYIERQEKLAQSKLPAIEAEIKDESA